MSQSPQQPQLEIPPISFARYFDLLKRRRWQVLPMSLVGLLIGTCVAFLIPRYYVASTTLTYRGSVRPDAQDPLLAKVLNAETSVPNAVEDALVALSRIGTDESDPARLAAIEEVRARLEARGYQTDRRSPYFNVDITYRDTEGQFSADFCNQVRDIWVQRIKDELEQEAQQELSNARREVRDIENARGLALRNLEVYVEKHRINALAKDPQLERSASLETRRGELLGRQTDLEVSLSGLERRITLWKQRLGLMSPTRDAQVDLSGDPELLRQYAAANQALLVAKTIYDGAGPSHPKKELYRLQFEAAQARVAELEASSGPGVQLSTEPNKDYAALKEKIDDVETEFEAGERELAIIDRKLAGVERQIDALPTIFSRFESLKVNYESLQKKHDAATKVESELNTIAQQTRQSQPFKVPTIANVPPAPTEPNITLVAVTGSLLGLAAAIGLVLLLDFLRSTFKTVEDVKYGLRVPVLGTMAHIETALDRRLASRHRRRISVVAASFLLASVSVLTIYYIAPTRLPQAVLQTLDTILGPAQ